MKSNKLNLLIFLVVLCSLSGFSQTVRRVNNSGLPLGPNMYASLQEAHNAAAAGDIIYIEGSGTDYSGATISKRLTIIGPGYFLGENYNYFPDLRSANFYENDIIFNPGSAGSVLLGCSEVHVQINTSNITVSRNHDLVVYLGYNVNAAITGIVVNKNYDITVSGWTNAYGVDVLISNNHITSTSYLYNPNYSGTFSNNVMVGSFSLRNFNVSNNILVTSNANPTFTNCSITNNIDARALVNSTAFGTTNGNLGNIDKNTLFAGTTGNSTDGQWKLKVGSVAIGAGVGGVDCGLYGGSNPYLLSGVSTTDYPTITKFTTSGSGNSTTPLQVTISTTTN